MLPQIGAGTFYFPSIYLDDAAQAVAHSCQVPGGIYNICDDAPLLWKD